MAQVRQRGFTMVELMIALAIASFLVVLAAPGYTLWVADSQVRNGAESVADGLRMAQSIAVSRNLNSQFVLSPTGWTIAMVDAPGVILQTGTFNEGAKGLTFTGVDSGGAAATTSTFNALGQSAGAGTLVKVDVTNPAVAGSRTLRVITGAYSPIGFLNGVKLCDPSRPASDPQGCPP
jgi:type IV fimbrial biogenesis protein FimT